MSFMEKQITERMRGWRVESKNGTDFVPGDVVSVPLFIAKNVPIPAPEHGPKPLVSWGHRHDTAIFYALAERLRPYTDGDTVIEIEVIEGYFGRFSAPGYLDCTAWVYGATKRELNEHLRDTEA
jgi:hypothetical protein